MVALSHATLIGRGGGIGAIFMKPDDLDGSIWRLLWATAEKQIMHAQLSSYKRSEKQVLQHQKKADTIILSMDWEVGMDFDTSWAKSKAISQVEQALVCVTK